MAKVKKGILCMFLVVFLLIFQSNDITAGFFDSDYYSRREFFGGYIGIDMGLINHYEAAPVIGYRLTPWLHTGLGAKYQYFYDKRLGNVYRAHLFGPIAFTDVIAIKNLDEFLPFRFIEGAVNLRGEVNYFNLPTGYFDPQGNHEGSKRFFRPTWLVGGGLQRPAGTNRSFNIMVLFDISGQSPKVYSNALLRFGFTF